MTFAELPLSGRGIAWSVFLTTPRGRDHYEDVTPGYATGWAELANKTAVIAGISVALWIVVAWLVS